MPFAHVHAGSDITRRVTRAVQVLMREYLKIACQPVEKEQPTDRLGRLFVCMLCPPTPGWLDLAAGCKLLLALLVAASYVAVYGSFLLVPLWLAAIRQAWAWQRAGQAVLIAIAGLLALLGADSLVKWHTQDQAARMSGLITASSLPPADDPVLCSSAAEPAAGAALPHPLLGELQALLPLLETHVYGSAGTDKQQSGADSSLESIRARLAAVSAQLGLPLPLHRSSSAHEPSFVPELMTAAQALQRELGL